MRVIQKNNRFKPLIYADILVGFTAFVGSLLTLPFASAGTESFNFVLGVNAVCTLSSSTSSTVSKTISPGTSDEIGTSKIKALCNDPGGLAIYAVGYSDDSYGDNYLHPTNISDIYRIASGTSTTGDTSSWGMSITNDSTVSSNNSLDITDGYELLHRIPETFTKVAERDAKTDATVGANINATFSAYIAPTQAADTYEGTVKFTLVHPSTGSISDDDTYPATLTAYFINADPASTTGVNVTSLSCTKTSSEAPCNITLPDFSVRSGYDKIGWGLNSNGSGTHYDPGDIIDISRGTTFYTISAHHYTATFVNQHTQYYSISSNSETCYAYNGAASCVVQTPTTTKLTEDTYNFRGWATSSDAAVPIERSDVRLSLSADGIYYSVIAVPTGSYSLNFVDGSYSGATSVESIEESTKTCYTYSDQNTCVITAPNFTAADGYVAYGYDIAKYNELKTTTVEIGDDITVTSATNGTTYYTVARAEQAEAVTFVNQHPNQLDAGSTIENCYTYNGYYYCKVYAPTLTVKDSTSGGSAVGWNTSKTATTASPVAGGMIYVYKGSSSVYYSVASGFSYTITFSTNVDFTGSDPTGSNWTKQNNIGADSLSFYTTTCTVRDGGCYIDEVPRIYSTGNTPAGFSLTQYGDANIDFLLDHNFTADTTVYARVFNWGQIDFMTGVSDRIYFNNEHTEYFQIDYESNVQASLSTEFTSFISQVFTNAPQLQVLHGKMRFYTQARYNERHGSGSQMLTGPNTMGMFSPIEVKPTSDYTALSSYAKAAAVHEMGHALDHYYLEMTGKTLSRQDLIAPLYAQYKADYDAYIAQHGTFIVGDGVPLRAYSYTNMNEFIADCFSDWYAKRTGHFYDSGHGDTTQAIDDALDYYLCGGIYANSAVCIGGLG